MMQAVQSFAEIEPRDEFRHKISENERLTSNVTPCRAAFTAPEAVTSKDYADPSVRLAGKQGAENIGRQV